MNEIQSVGAAQIEREHDDDAPDVPEAFTVRDEGSANWVIRQIVERRTYAKRCAEWCEREQARAQREEEFFLFRFVPQLRDFARQRISEQGGRRKSVNFPAGTLGFRKNPSRIIVDDEAVVIAWARLHKPELIVVAERLSKSCLNQHAETTGELPNAGIHIEAEREDFYIK
jgi:phage host-nuclease inhibitor protein Gam